MGKYIKYLSLITYFSSILISYGQNNVSVYANKNFWNVFVFDFKTNRYCYYLEKDVFVGCPIYSRGSFEKKENIIIIKSDYDNMKLPIDVKCKNKSETKQNKILFNIIHYNKDTFNNAAYELERKKLLYFVINNIDTIRLNKDTITYNKNINNFYIISMNYDGYIYYKTKIYNNVNRCNFFEINYCLNPLNAFYKTMNDTIIFNKKTAKWHLDEEITLNLKKISITEIQQIIGSCECWNKKGIFNFNIDTPNCLEINNNKYPPK